MTDIRCPNCQKKIGETRPSGHFYNTYHCGRCKRRFAVMLFNGQLDSQMLDKVPSLV